MKKEIIEFKACLESAIDLLFLSTCADDKKSIAEIKDIINKLNEIRNN